jgi:hypothetical protein
VSEMPIVGRIVRDSQNECLIKKGKYWNIDVIDIRWHGSGGKPTRKGIRLNVEEAKMLIDILRRELE